MGRSSRIAGWGAGACIALGGVAGAAAGATEFVRGGVYAGPTSQHHTITIHVAAGGRTATVLAGMRAHCSGHSKYVVRSTYVFDAVFRHNPARISGSRMSIREVDHNLPPSGFIPRAKTVRQTLAARANAGGQSLRGSYSELATLPDGRTCTTGTVSFTARLK